MGLSVWRETSKKLTVYRVCYTPIETLVKVLLHFALTTLLHFATILLHFALIVRAVFI